MQEKIKTFLPSSLAIILEGGIHNIYVPRFSKISTIYVTSFSSISYYSHSKIDLKNAIKNRHFRSIILDIHASVVEHPPHLIIAGRASQFSSFIFP